MSKNSKAAGLSSRSRFVAGRRWAEQNNATSAFRAEWAKVRQQQSETRQKDDERLRMMARVEPARYLKLVASGAVKGTYSKEAQRRL